MDAGLSEEESQRQSETESVSCYFENVDATKKGKIMKSYNNDFDKDDFQSYEWT